MRSFAVPGAIALITVLVLLPLAVSPRKGEADPAQQAQPAAAAQNPAPSSGKVYGEWFIRVKPDKGAQYGQLIQEKGLTLFSDAGGRMVGWWKTLVGDLYEQVTIWEFDGMAGFEKAVGLLGKDERFSKFVAERDPLLSGESSAFLRLAGFAEKPALPEAGKFVVHEVHRVPLGRRLEYLRFMERALPLLQKHGFHPVGPFETGVGRWNQVTYLFRYESLAERDQLMASFTAQPYGVTYSVRIGELVDDIQTRILVPAPFVK